MQKLTILFFLTLFTFDSCSQTQLKKTVNYQNTTDKKISEDLSELIYKHTKMFPNNTQLAFAFIKNGKTEYYGIEKRNDTIFSNENHKNAFEIGSITKVFTSVLLADMVIDSSIILNSDINQYYDFQFNKNQKITFKSLANHTSGLPRMPSNFELDINNSDPFANYTEENLMDYLANELELSQNKVPKWNYSNVGAGLLGYTLSKIKKKPLNDLYEHKIFSRYNMTNSIIGSENVTTKLVQGLDRNGQPINNWNFGPLSGAGAIISTVEDLSKFSVAQFKENNTILNLTRTETHKIDKKSSIGLGWEWYNKPNGNWYWHNGGTGGYTSCIIIDTIKKNSIIILSNVSATSEPMDNIDKLCFAIMEKL